MAIRLKWRGSQQALEEHQKVVSQKKPKLRKKRNNKKSKQKHIPYNEYLQSKWWRNKRLVKLKATKFKCERCRSEEDLRVHHKHYKSLWKEKNRDLETLCKTCHDSEHECLIQCNDHLRSIMRCV